MKTDHDIEWLAAEYVLGSLTPAERSAIALRSRTDKRLGAAIAGWEKRLGPLVHREPGMPAPEAALHGVLATIGKNARAAQDGATVIPLHGRVRQWRMTAGALAAASALLAVALGVLWQRSMTEPGGPMLAVLTRSGHEAAADEPAATTGPVFLAAYDGQSRSLSLRVVASSRSQAERAYSLWLQRDSSGESVLIGRLARGSSAAKFEIPGDMRIPTGGVALVIRMDAGAQPGNATGPVVARGILEPVGPAGSGR